MVEGQHFVEEQQARVGNAQLIFGRQLGQPLDLPHGIVGKKAHCAGGEWRQPVQPRRLVSAERVAQHGKDVAVDVRCLAWPSVMAISRPRATIRLNGREPDERVAPHLLAALD